eukprot:CAMPEP_0185841724 /NCGR_PEP_ID=MMETSP1353-20130828/18041_1 /TAXON_ID=1077150 /ORGANISM="Erythrolobus australicus, Strain CCMP3124" /LENGTH=103 /DNA_ID=CAMNT_0028541211 /DNA_START=893 /DNA_END=1200 /DNA_ORIENTATION=-
MHRLYLAVSLHPAHQPATTPSTRPTLRISPVSCNLAGTAALRGSQRFPRFCATSAFIPPPPRAALRTLVLDNTPEPFSPPHSTRFYATPSHPRFQSNFAARIS